MERFSDCVLVDVQVPEIGLHLQNGKDLVTRTPYPNKTLLVGSRNIGRKAIAGLLIRCPDGYRSTPQLVAGPSMLKLS
ncbi:TPA: DUF6012 family protein [Pseudomonas aeruginosa]